MLQGGPARCQAISITSRGGYEVIEDQWDNTVSAVLSALAPIHFRCDGGVDWGAERGPIFRGSLGSLKIKILLC